MRYRHLLAQEDSHSTLAALTEPFIRLDMAGPNAPASTFGVGVNLKPIHVWQPFLTVT